jgi:hypothetical protein
MGVTTVQWGLSHPISRPQKHRRRRRTDGDANLGSEGGVHKRSETPRPDPMTPPLPRNKRSETAIVVRDMGHMETMDYLTSSIVLCEVSLSSMSDLLEIKNTQRRSRIILFRSRGFVNQRYLVGVVKLKGGSRNRRHVDGTHAS